MADTITLYLILSNNSRRRDWFLSRHGGRALLVSGFRHGGSRSASAQAVATAEGAKTPPWLNSRNDKTERLAGEKLVPPAALRFYF